MARTKPEKEPRIRIVISPDGVERVEVWGRDESDSNTALSLYFRVQSAIQSLHQAARASLNA